ncbi:rCG53526 [Rattus norvegicus]|uniref:RCG53526 n=1 Tax=Rattus norvegicus TaxID=10116 RepID=A6JRS2_RAT|nr:rCG53526 [Rattus norvegicus]
MYLNVLPWSPASSFCHYSHSF